MPRPERPFRRPSSSPGGRRPARDPDAPASDRSARGGDRPVRDGDRRRPPRDRAEAPRRPKPDQEHRGADRRSPEGRPDRRNFERSPERNSDRRPENSRPKPGGAPSRDRPARSGDRPRPPRDQFTAPRGDTLAHERRNSKSNRPNPNKPAEKAALWVPSDDARLVRTEAGQDLAHFLVNHSGKHMSVRAARRLLEAGGCRINGRVETFGSRLLRYGEIVEFYMPEDREHHFDRKRVLMDNVSMIAYDKPAFLPVTPTDGPKSWSLYDILTRQLGELHPVHRLDADTSGIVLFARTPQVAERLQAMFRDHAVKKTYRAIVRGHPPEVGERRSYLVKQESRKGFEKWASGRGPDAREAITAWRVTERLSRYASLVEIEPRTGRYHQIRIHFSEMDFPLYGDRLYGDRKDPIHCARHLLHACRIQLPNPASGPSIDLTAPMPEDFAHVSMQLKKL